MKKVIAIVAVLFCVFCGVNTSFAVIKNSPDGFRGVKWGDRASNHKRLEHQYRIGLSDYLTYMDPGDDLSIGGADLEYIKYRFTLMTGFSRVEIKTASIRDFAPFIDALFERFGEGEQLGEYQYSWKDDNVQMRLFLYNGGLCFVMESQASIKHFLESRQEAAKAGAKSDF